MRQVSSVKYCVSCLQPDTRPNTVFTESGQCPTCAYLDGSLEIDWDERFEILNDLVLPYRRKGNSGFDCIIGVSGGKDSTRQALWVRDKLKMNPLLFFLGHPPQQISHFMAISSRELGSSNPYITIGKGWPC